MPLRFINPNFHVILIHYPLGVFVLGVFLELFAFLWRRSSIRIAARWMIVIGALLTLPGATSGIFALADVRHNQGINDARYHMLRLHVIFMGIASLLAVFCAVLAIGATDRLRNTLHYPLLAGFVAVWALMVMGAWRGGETIYQNGTSVAIIHLNDDQKPELTPLTVPTPPSIKSYEAVEYFGGGVFQQHLIMAGFALAIAMGALGLSIRKSHGETAFDASDADVLAAASGGAQRHVTDDMSVIRSFNPDSAISGEPPVVPAGRWWLLAALVVIATVGLGYWTQVGQGALTADGWQTFVDELKRNQWKPPTRHMMHLILGGSFLVLALLMAICAAAAPRAKALLVILGTLLVVALAGEVWIGVLMTFDGKNEANGTYKAHHEGPLTGFTPAKKVKKVDDEDAPSSGTPTPAAPVTPAPTPATAPSGDSTPATPAPTPEPIPATPTRAPAPSATPSPDPAPAPAPSPAPAPTPAPTASTPAPTPAPAPATTDSKKSLYDRLGGNDTITSVVTDFVDRAAGDSKVAFTRVDHPNHWDPSPENVAKLKKHLVQFIAGATGGPNEYKAGDMTAVHTGMQITNEEFDALAADLRASLEKFNVPAKEEKELMTIVGKTRESIVGK